jgi:hypothetical protein
MDAVEYALSSVESCQADDQAVRNALHLAGELSTEVGRSQLFLRKRAPAAALRAFQELRRAASLLRLHLDDVLKEETLNGACDARAAYEATQAHMQDLIDDMQG